MANATAQRMDEYRTLGRTGLKVSPLGLGVMTYGWGADKQAARAKMERMLTEASRPESTELDHFFERTMQGMVHGGVAVQRGVA